MQDRPADAVENLTVSADIRTPAQAFAELGRIPITEPPLHDLLLKIAVLARRTIAAATEVSVTVVARNQATTVAHAGDRALALDQGQYRAGYGPCLDAARSGQVVVVTDMANEKRWPAYTPSAHEQGARSSLSIPLPVQHHTVGGLNLYATSLDAFDERAVELALAFAGYAAVALANAYRHTATAQLIEDMRAAMHSRAVIEQAKGILIARHGGTLEAALGQLTLTSQYADRTLCDTAEDLVLHAQLPPAP
ncbi:GAF and ANTAR domain-containing protein [Cryptosporangium arvum]|uniref:GAF domain-containing protein n=1 Tax=Cryptosporangium arvum DSM 44712 TaxID=927661 RepID=A0A010ZPU8_9ACTN|nr:GAF and ANTAR domain-containing protein [Cryptosporangium arvum]EXG79232.1 GAF domain-containing protein [Cryptosporangium arvum DSM 44712]